MRPSSPRRPLAVLIALFFLAILPISAIAAEPAAVDRLAHVAKLWGTVRYLHPSLAYKDIDWDAAFVKAVPAVRAAKSREEYLAAVDGMLSVLGDPATHVARNASEAVEEAAGETPTPFRWIGDTTLAIHLRPDFGGGSYGEMRRAFRSMRTELPKAKAVVIDLRSFGGEPYAPEEILNEISDLLVSRPLELPTQRYLLHSGYRGQSFRGSGGYWSGFVTLFANRVEPAEGMTRKRVVFLVNRGTVVPPLALALQAAGDGAIVAEGGLSPDAGAQQKRVDLGEDAAALVRVTEIVPFPGWTGLHADREVAKDAFETAVQMAATPFGTPAATSPTPLPEGVWRPDKTYKEMLAPALEYRLLAVTRMWNVIDYFYPYKSLIGDWDAVLPEFLARMETAEGAKAYALGIAAMAARVADGHTNVFGHPELAKLRGEAYPPFELRPIEGSYVVTDVSTDPKVQASGLQRGDVVTAVDGRPIEERIAELRPYVAASTEAGQRLLLGLIVVGGPKDSTLRLTVRGADGKPREVAVQRGAYFSPANGEVVRILPGNVGYADLTRLTVAEVDGMFETLKDTRGIIFDMRGYPRGTAWPIAPRLHTRPGNVAAQFRRSQVSAFSAPDEGESGFFFSQFLPVSPKPRYERPTVMLIDERAVSQAEHTGLFFEAANGTQFIGTPSAGTNGDITDLSLPGGVTMFFTGHDVRHADGRQLQRVGLQPDVLVAPTIAGIRAGRDEVLDRALRYLLDYTPPPGGQQ